MSTHSPDSETPTATPVREQWSSISKHVFNSYLEANNAFLASMGVQPPTASKTTDADRDCGASTTVESPLAELAFADEAWLTERSVEEHDELGVGEYVRFTKRISESDVSAFATASGDTNRLHLEDGFAETTQFGGRIAHGTLVAGTISAALARFPGTTVYLSQDLEFLAPVEIGDAVTAECELLEDLGDDRYRVRTTVSAASDDGDENDDGRTVIDGEAVVAISPLPDE
ncbi:Acyl dehydratase [Halobiforma haloterrestris]|uniref:Acyl dehydratase n=1 Tax=Natronobacterium haloterrestre TaxID=148448 RepID=A0A1I1GE33_NATHA|nr:MaoC family dehydratase [Halobiforma haloterrestris]SFC09715.1 Acyl dehydratase [Halobiforma haloterrestris]